MTKKYISFGVGYEEVACMIINKVKVFNIDYLKIQENKKQKEKVACYA